MFGLSAVEVELLDAAAELREAREAAEELCERAAGELGRCGGEPLDGSAEEVLARVHAEVSLVLDRLQRANVRAMRATEAARRASVAALAGEQEGDGGYLERERSAEAREINMRQWERG
jgi:hypothetical protein